METRKALLALHLTGVVGPRRLAALLQAFPEPAAAFGAPASILSALRDWTPASAAKVLSLVDPAGTVERELDRARNAGVQVTVAGDPDFPGVFRDLYDPPFVLWSRGLYLPADEKAMAVVGCRKPSAYGLQVASRLAGDLARGGYTVVSGLARGIDRAAHEGALAAKGGRTIAFLGSGFLQLYPPENASLAERIAGQGVLFSEYPLDSKPLSLHFPQRNRLISGASRGVLVVEAEEDSGSLITVDHALDQGRSVFAVPGPIHQEQSKGTHALIRDGAKLVMEANDVFRELGDPVVPAACRARHGATVAPAPDLTSEEAILLDRLSFQPVHLDALVRETGLPARRLSELLLVLEMKGRVSQAPGHCFFRL
jgi:DNA processing protein